MAIEEMMSGVMIVTIRKSMTEMHCGVLIVILRLFVKPRAMCSIIRRAASSTSELDAAQSAVAWCYSESKPDLIQDGDYPLVKPW